MIKIKKLRPCLSTIYKKDSLFNPFQNHKALFFYLIFFLLIFIQFPLNKSLPGNSTTWLALTISNAYSQMFSHIIKGEPFTTFLYPIKNIFVFGQGAPFLALWFLIIKGLIGKDIWAYYLFISTLFALSGWGIYYLARILEADFWPSMIAGFFFSCSNFTFANIDDPHEIFFLFPTLMIAFLFKFKKKGINRHLYLAMIFGALEIYCSVYIFFFQAFFLVPFLIFLIKEKSPHLKTFFKGLALFFIISLPVFCFHLYNYFNFEIVNPFDPMAVIRDCSLKWRDFFAPLKGNLLYGGRTQDLENPLFWSFIRRHAFLGVIFSTLGILGIFKLKKAYPSFFWMALISMIFCLGPIWELGKNIVIPSPLFWFYENIPLFVFIRVPLRAFFFTSLSLSIFAALFLSHFPHKIKGFNYFLGLIIFFHIIENYPFPMQKFRVKNLLSPPSALFHFFREKKGQVLLDLPSKLGIEFHRSQDFLFPYNRELIYMYWQTQHKQNIVGGVHGYWPKSRINLQSFINQIPNENAFSNLKSIGISQIIFHKDMILENEDKILKEIKSSPIVKLEYEDEKLAIFGWQRI